MIITITTMEQIEKNGWQDASIKPIIIIDNEVNAIIDTIINNQYFRKHDNSKLSDEEIMKIKLYNEISPNVICDYIKNQFLNIINLDTMKLKKLSYKFYSEGEKFTMDKIEYKKIYMNCYLKRVMKLSPKSMLNVLDEKNINDIIAFLDDRLDIIIEILDNILISFNILKDKYYNNNNINNNENDKTYKSIEDLFDDDFNMLIEICRKKHNNNNNYDTEQKKTNLLFMFFCDLQELIQDFFIKYNEINIKSYDKTYKDFDNEIEKFDNEMQKSQEELIEFNIINDTRKNI